MELRTSDDGPVSPFAQLSAGAGEDSEIVPAEDRSGRGTSPIEAHIEAAVERAVTRLLRPYLRRICEPEPAVYTVAQAAVVLQVSQDTVARLVRRGVLARVPHLHGKVLVPRSAIDVLISASSKTVKTCPGNQGGQLCGVPKLTRQQSTP